MLSFWHGVMRVLLSTENGTALGYSQLKYFYLYIFNILFMLCCRRTKPVSLSLFIADFVYQDYVSQNNMYSFPFNGILFEDFIFLSILYIYFLCDNLCTQQKETQIIKIPLNLDSTIGFRPSNSWTILISFLQALLRVFYMTTKIFISKWDYSIPRITRNWSKCSWGKLNSFHDIDMADGGDVKVFLYICFRKHLELFFWSFC